MISCFGIVVDVTVREFASVFLKNFCVFRWGTGRVLHSTSYFLPQIQVQGTTLIADSWCHLFLSINPNVVYPYHVLAVPFCFIDLNVRHRNHTVLILEPLIHTLTAVSAHFPVGGNFFCFGRSGAGRGTTSSLSCLWNSLIEALKRKRCDRRNKGHPSTHIKGWISGQNLLPTKCQPVRSSS